jgi:hypothetical protein
MLNNGNRFSVQHPRSTAFPRFNQNKPYDRFVKEQIAGDELWPNDPWARVATGFNRQYPDESKAAIYGSAARRS